MRNLLKTELKLLFKLKLLYYEIGFIVLLAILMGFTSILNDEPPITSFFNGLFIVGMMQPALGGTLLLTDFKQKTINNKIIAGHSRFNIYTAKFISLIVLVALSSLAYGATSFIMSLFDTISINWTIFLKNILVVVMSSFFNVCMMLFFNMILHNEGGLAISTIMAEVFPMGGMFLLEFLTISDNYKTIADWVTAFPPVQTMMLSLEAAPMHIGYTAIMTLISFTIFFFGGFIIFKKQDLP